MYLFKNNLVDPDNLLSKVDEIKIYDDIPIFHKELKDPINTIIYDKNGDPRKYNIYIKNKTDKVHINSHMDTIGNIVKFPTKLRKLEITENILNIHKLNLINATNKKNIIIIIGALSDEKHIKVFRKENPNNLIITLNKLFSDNLYNQQIDFNKPNELSYLLHLKSKVSKIIFDVSVFKFIDWNDIDKLHKILTIFYNILVKDGELIFPCCSDKYFGYDYYFNHKWYKDGRKSVEYDKIIEYEGKEYWFMYRVVNSNIGTKYFVNELIEDPNDLNPHLYKSLFKYDKPTFFIYPQIYNYGKEDDKKFIKLVTNEFGSIRGIYAKHHNRKVLELFNFKVIEKRNEVYPIKNIKYGDVEYYMIAKK